MRAATRRLWLKLHLWVGLSLGGVFALLGLTGSVLVFYLEVDTLINPQIRVEAPAPLPSADVVFAQLQRLHPERTGPWRIEMPLAPDRPLLVRYYNPPETAGRGFAPLMLSLDPHTLAETSHRYWGDYLTTWLYDLHYTLLLGQTGKDIVGYSGLVMLFSLISGMVLWWPSRARLMAALRPVLRPGKVRWVYDLHVLSGVYGLVVLAALAFTGAVLSLPDLARPVVATLSPLTPLYRGPGGLLPEGTPAFSLDAAMAIARGELPQGEVRWIETPGQAGRPIAIRMYLPEDPGHRFPHSQVWIDPGTGAVLATRDYRRNTAGDSFMDWMHPLHNGEAFGLTGRILACIGGLIPTLLLVTGWLRWQHKRAARDKARGGELMRSRTGGGGMPVGRRAEVE
ncbi:PepSY domain-containing protein [Zoogloea sp.]|uniref:PepSY-associated TM helix domain-containing protein n=1 Tax=Zoogloea sp. TaxID=49181 RepID=UPI0025ED2D04|nr:PepSY-associated TM helix domain-containing protein [Zoogloea sp.]MCK6395188.1 PepSY domain-containing protein [Zoogloea sp.]